MRKPAFGLLHRLAHLAARVISLGFLLFWGAFFIEHLTWFADPAHLPAAEIWLAQALHFLLLVGYALSLFWGRLGCVVIALGAALFFGLTGGANALWFALLSLAPIPFFILAWISKPAPAVQA